MNLFKTSFNAATDIPPLTGKVILITGSSNGLGKQCVIDYAQHDPAEIWLCARSIAKAQAALDDIKPRLPTPAPPIKLLEMDLASLESVQKAAETFKQSTQRLDILMLNAGIMATSPGLSVDGFEIQFQTNYLGHALLAKLLLSVLQKTAKLPNADVRIVSVTSHGHHMAPGKGIESDTLRTDAAALGPLGRYGQSKIAQIFFTRWMARRYPEITSVVVHPGVVSTGLVDKADGFAWWARGLAKAAKWVVPGPQTGARNQLWASVAEVRSGTYYEPGGVEGGEDGRVRDEGVGERLRGWTEEVLGKWV